MVIRSLLVIILFLSACFAYSQTEQQWKYVIPNDVSKSDFLLSTQKDQDFSIHYHSKYTYYDLYLETSDFLLSNNGFGLRIRKRMLTDSIATYSLQLKSEMTEHQDIRMEIEEDLDYYKVLANDQFVDLKKILDTIFQIYDSGNIIEDSIRFTKNVNLVQQWIKTKVDSPISAFQKLKHLNPAVFNSESLSRIQPFICCKSLRERGHVYIDRGNENSKFNKIPVNPIKQSVNPDFFKKNKNFIWIMEVSFDQTESMIISGKYANKIYSIREFEVENKYSDQMKGTEMLKDFETFLISNLKARKEYDSKYKQIVKSLNN